MKIIEFIQLPFRVAILLEIAEKFHKRKFSSDIFLIYEA